MSAVEQIFASRARAEGRAALVGYLPAGFPTVDGVGRAAHRRWSRAACDLLEVGLPYSDPVMDGPTIQAAADIALRGGVRMRDVLARRRAGGRGGRPGGRHDLLEPGRCATASTRSPATSPRPAALG